MKDIIEIRFLELFGENPTRWRGSTDDEREVYLRYRRGRLQLFVDQLPPEIREGELDPGCRVEPYYEVQIGDPQDHRIGATELLTFLASAARLPEWVAVLARKEEALRASVGVPLTQLELKPRALRILTGYLHRHLGKGADDLTIADAAGLKAGDLLRMNGFGQRSLEDLYAALQRRGVEVGCEHALRVLWGTHLWLGRSGSLDGVIGYGGDYVDL